MYGIYANINGGILMGSMLPYIEYMDPSWVLVNIIMICLSFFRKRWERSYKPSIFLYLKATIFRSTSLPRPKVPASIQANGGRRLFDA